MKVPSWLVAASTAVRSSSSDERKQQNRHLDSDGSTDSATSSSSSSSSCYMSLHTNLSLQTLPSVPSLQGLSPENSKAVVSFLCVTAFNLNLPVNFLAVSGGFIYAVSGHEISVYDRLTCSVLDNFNGEDSSSGAVKWAAFSAGKIFTAHQDGKIGVWKLTPSKGHSLIKTLPTLSDRLWRFALPSNYVQVRRHRKRLWIEHADAVTALAVNAGLIYSVSWDKTLKIWRASDLRCLESVKAHEDAINAVAVSASGTVYTGSADRRIRVWAKPPGSKGHTLIATLEKHKSAVNALALSDDGSVLFSGSCDRSILVWEREDTANYMAVAGALRGHGGAILSLINGCGLLFSGSADRTVRVWQRGEVGKYCCLGVLEGHQRPVKCLAAVTEEGDGNGVVSVMSGSLDGEVRVWRVSFSPPDTPLTQDFTPPSL